jgi:DNA repair protein RadC|tara:strand:+ start:3013 stop:3183 length:171 start_codon:yes stop_codon:yes gene_type:complete
MVHNHPSGDPNPSKNDKEITMKLHNASKILDIELLDHIILGEKKLFSIKENRLIII